jgi:serine/threonine protein phosphatase PrpC
MVTSFGISKIGLIRKVNEDAICMNSSPFFALADGMGGYNGGKLASTIAVSAAEEVFKKYQGQSISPEVLKDAVLDANKKILERKKESEEYAYMGTTMIAAAVQKDKLYWAHVGDSRLYIFDHQKLHQITTDHSFVMELVNEGKITKEEMRNHPRKNEITRAVGVKEDLKVDTGSLSLHPNDLILICSDGLSNMLSDEKITSILLKFYNNNQWDLQGAANELIDHVYQAGANDNVSLILIDYKDEMVEQ